MTWFLGTKTNVVLKLPTYKLSGVSVCSKIVRSDLSDLWIESKALVFNDEVITADVKNDNKNTYINDVVRYNVYDFNVSV